MIIFGQGYQLVFIALLLVRLLGVLQMGGVLINILSAFRKRDPMKSIDLEVVSTNIPVSILKFHITFLFFEF